MSVLEQAAEIVGAGLAILGLTGVLMIIGAVIGATRISRRRDPFADLDDADFMAIADAISERHGDIAACPDCGTDLVDEAFDFWCPSCQQAVSFNRAIDTGAIDD